MRILAEIRPEERRPAYAAFLTLFGLIAAHTVLETARDALFLARLPAAELPWLYLAMTAVAVALAQVPARRWHGLGRSGLAASLGVMALVTAVFWALPGLRGAWGLRALYVWTGLVATLSALQFWLVLGETFTLTQAKRVYRLVGTGSLLGAVAGASLARVVSGALGTAQLVPTAALLMAATALGPALLLRHRRGRSTRAMPLRWTLSEARQLIDKQPYVTRLAGLVLVSTIAVTLGDFVFKSNVARAVPAAELGSFFAGFYMVLNVLALVAQLALMGWLLRRVGLHRTLWLMPVLLFLGAAGVALGAGLPAALWLKGVDGTFRHSVNRTGTELLFLPIPDALRARVKPIIDVFGQRGGQAIASLFILSQLELGRGDLALAGAAALLCIVWVGAAHELVPHYIQMFRQALREGRQALGENLLKEAGSLPELDLNSLEALFAGLNSADDVEVIASMDLLLTEGKGALIPALILYHPSRAVVLRALEIFDASGRSDYLPLAGRLLRSEDPEIRVAALHALSAVQPSREMLREALDDPSPLVRATAAVRLVAAGGAEEGAETLVAPLLAADPVADTTGSYRALARAIERHPLPAFDATLQRLALCPEAEVQIAVAHAMGARRDERFLPALLALLARHEVRVAAGQALVGYGGGGLQFLDGALGDPSYPQELRRQIPRTIARFTAPEAGRTLTRHLLEEEDGAVRFKILRALNRLAADNPDLPLDRTTLKEGVRRTLGVVFSLAHVQHTLAEGVRERPERATPGQELLATLLRDKQAQAVERLFRLLGLLYRKEDFANIHRGVLSTSPRLRSSSRELLEAVVKRPAREAVLAVVDGAPWPESAAVAAPYYQAEANGYQELLASLVASPSETVRCLAAHHVAELGLVQLKPTIEARRAQETGLFVGRVLEKTLRLLERTGALGYAG